MFCLCYRCKKNNVYNSSIDHAYNDEKASVYSQLRLTCGITTNELMNQTELCKATKYFTCYACSLKCCSRKNLEHHMQNDHKISMKCAVTSYSKEMEISESMNHPPNEDPHEGFRKVR